MYLNENEAGDIAIWSDATLSANLVVFANIFGALLLGLIAVYERTYHGRAAGMRTYGLVCMAACALTVFAGYPLQWFGGTLAEARYSCDTLLPAMATVREAADGLEHVVADDLWPLATCQEMLFVL